VTDDDDDEEEKRVLYMKTNIHLRMINVSDKNCRENSSFIKI